MTGDLESDIAIMCTQVLVERQARAVRVQRADTEKAAAEARSERLAAGATQREAFSHCRYDAAAACQPMVVRK